MALWHYKHFAACLVMIKAWKIKAATKFNKKSKETPEMHISHKYSLIGKERASEL